MAIIFDSNVWIALFNENDAHHENARQLFSENSVIYVPEYVICALLALAKNYTVQTFDESLAKAITSTN